MITGFRVVDMKVSPEIARFESSFQRYMLSQKDEAAGGDAGPAQATFDSACRDSGGAEGPGQDTPTLDGAPDQSWHTGAPQFSDAVLTCH